MLHIFFVSITGENDVVSDTSVFCCWSGNKVLYVFVQMFRPKDTRDSVRKQAHKGPRVCVALF